MIRDFSDKQLSLPEFGVPFATQLDQKNRWVKKAEMMPWNELEAAYYQSLNPSQGRPAKPGRLVIGAVIIKHEKGLSDEETVREIEESPYLQFFCGLKEFTTCRPFAPSLFVEIRKRMGADVFERFHQAVIDRVSEVTGKSKTSVKSTAPKDNEDDKDDGAATKVTPSDKMDTDDKTATGNQEAEGVEEVRTAGTVVPGDTPANQGKMLVDATVSEQMIRYPTDLGLVNEAREISEAIIDTLYKAAPLAKKPRTYRKRARKDYLALVKQRRPKAKARRRAVRQQLQYLRRNIKHIDSLIDMLPLGEPIPWKKRQQRQFWIIQQLYAQQEEMWRTKTKRCDDRIVSIHQPHVRPIIRGKANKPVEFGSKLSVSMDRRGLAHVDHLGWDAFNEGGDLKDQVEAYKDRYGHYPAKVLADPLYGTQENRAFLKDIGIRFAGKPLGRPKKQTDENRQELKAKAKRRQEEYRQRIPIEGKFGQGKNGYGLAKIRARRQDTSEAWIRSIFFVMNLVVLFREFLLCLILAAMQAIFPSHWLSLALMRLHRLAFPTGLLPQNQPIQVAPTAF